MSDKPYMDRCIELEARIAALEATLEGLIYVAQGVADDHHQPRYTRLDEALANARAALAGAPR